jgi:hypothetical protein
MKSILITCAAWVVISAISSGFSFWKGVDHGKAIEKALCLGGQQTAGEEDIAIKNAQDDVLNVRLDDADFFNSLRDPKANF